jgi:pyrroline-5-carboxylate reductase
VWNAEPTAATAEEMVLQAFGSEEKTTMQVEVQPAMVAFVKGIMEALQDQAVKTDMEHYAKRLVAQHVSQASASLQQKGEE